VVLGEESVKMAHLQFHISLKFGEKRLKVEFNRKKLDFPDTIQIVLGVWVDQARQLVGLKPGYAPALVEQIDEVVHALRTEPDTGFVWVRSSWGSSSSAGRRCSREWHRCASPSTR